MNATLKVVLAREQVEDFVASLRSVFDEGFSEDGARRLASFFGRLWEPPTTPMPLLQPDAELVQGETVDEVRYFVFTIIGRSFDLDCQLGIQVEADSADACCVTLSAEEAWCEAFAGRFGDGGEAAS